MEHEKELLLAIKAAKAAGRYLRQRKEVSVDSEVGKDIKLSSDRESERLILDILSASGYPMVSEEKGFIAGTISDGSRWIIDPLDGSMNYWLGLDELACTSIALWNGDRPVLGVIYRFAADELFSGIVEEGAWLNGASIHTSAVEQVGTAVVGSGFPTFGDHDIVSVTKHMSGLMHFKKIRMLGTAALTGAFVSCGVLDAYMEEKIMLWDIAAAAAIVSAAGGVFHIGHLTEGKCICKLFCNEKLCKEFNEYIVNI